MTRPEPELSGVVVPIPELDPIVARHRRRLDTSAVPGVPAHVTVLFPFVPPRDLTDDVVVRLNAAVASVEAFDCTFAHTAWFDDELVWLAPEPDAPFRRLTAAVHRAFPAHPPYEGKHGESTPHATLGESRRGSRDELREAEADVLRHLPVAMRVKHAVLMTGSWVPNSWRIERVLALTPTTRDAGGEPVSKG